MKYREVELCVILCVQSRVVFYHTAILNEEKSSNLDSMQKAPNTWLL